MQRRYQIKKGKEGITREWKGVEVSKYVSAGRMTYKTTETKTKREG